MIMDLIIDEENWRHTPTDSGGQEVAASDRGLLPRGTGKDGALRKVSQGQGMGHIQLEHTEARRDWDIILAARSVSRGWRGKLL